jgi:hypothetical protein
MVERVLDEKIGVALVARVFGEDQSQRRLKSQFLHITGRRVEQVAVGGCAAR